ncbi:hypothetical protein Fcan01_23809 [Folsomia candida]|uniref:Uncharacterized protein n=1 Tax=Folsomia candida TaxID=158441 RepID=A0A226DAK4_FOLCA|nr:hypothetical protein Fcan01_23809 [Folsomia candida]
MSPHVSEFFGVFLIYTKIIEKSRLFGNCPFHWNSKTERMTMDLKFFSYYKFWFRIATTFADITILLLLLLWQYFIKRRHDILPFGVISFYGAAIVIVIGVVVMILPTLVLWNVFVIQEIERSFNMFIRLSSVCPSKENGSEITSTINQIAVFVAQLYTKLPIMVTIIFISVNLDPFYYVIPPVSFSLRGCIIIFLRFVLFLIAGIEACRLAVIAIFLALFQVNVVKREMHMCRNIAGRSNLGGMLFYRQFAILYNFRRLWATGMLTLITTVGFMLQYFGHGQCPRACKRAMSNSVQWGNVVFNSHGITFPHFYFGHFCTFWTPQYWCPKSLLDNVLSRVMFNYATITMFGIVPVAAYWVVPYVAVIVGITVQQIVDIAAETFQQFDENLKIMRRNCTSRRSILYRRLRSLPILGLCIILGGRSYPIRKDFKVEYRSACSNAQENPPEVEGTVKTLSGEILTSRVVVQRLKILGGQCPILLITLAFYEKIQHRGLPPPIVKVRKRKVITAMVRKVKIMTSKKNPHPKRDMASRVNVSKYTVSPILKRFDLVKRNKHRFRDATISCTTRKSSPTLERSNKR